jgi:hypothetical protein
VTEKDGGESLAPHVANNAVSAVEHSDDDAKPVAPAIAPAATLSAPAADAGATPAVTAPTQPVEETITTEDIIIEIDD